MNKIMVNYKEICDICGGHKDATGCPCCKGRGYHAMSELMTSTGYKKLSNNIRKLGAKSPIVILWVST